MADSGHKLTNIIVTEHGVGGVCTCGRWGSAQRTKRKLRQAHNAHKRDAK